MAPWRKSPVWIDGDGCNARGSPVRRVLRRLAEGAASVLGAAALVSCLPWRAWVPELVTGLSVQLGLLALLVAVLAGAVRSRLGAAVSLVATFVLLWPWGAGLFGRRLDAPGPGSSTLTLLIANAYALNDNPASFLAALEREEADVIVITEPTPAMLRPLVGGVSDLARSATLLRCPPTRGEHPWLIVISRLPVAELPGARDGVLVCDLETPDGPMRLVACHLLSPRTPARYAEAMRQLDRIETTLAEASLAGIPAIVAGDFNATPTSRSVRTMASRHGLRRGKPALRGGTFPSRAPGPLRFGIDDVAVPKNAAVEAWETIGLPGSDHRGVRVVLRPGHVP